jgi:hypothetical protein
MNPSDNSPDRVAEIAGLVERLRALMNRTEAAVQHRRALTVKYDTDYSPEADAEIRLANDERDTARALLSAAAVDALPTLRSAVDAIFTHEQEAERRGMEKAAVIADEHAEAWGAAMATPAIAIATAIRSAMPPEGK